ncbi:hypothetical protein, partial [Serratia grimesii]|uniref:hypothetical protein n=1 Tax=Serratia grimesii TaxID=82995 RepID=UPI001C3F14B8
PLRMALLLYAKVKSCAATLQLGISIINMFSAAHRQPSSAKRKGPEGPLIRVCLLFFTYYSG